MEAGVGRLEEGPIRNETMTISWRAEERKTLFIYDRILEQPQSL